MVTPVSTPETLTEQDTHIEFSDVTVRYDNEIALDSISLKIPRNQIFGIKSKTVSTCSEPSSLVANSNA